MSRPFFRVVSRLLLGGRGCARKDPSASMPAAHPWTYPEFVQSDENAESDWRRALP